MTERKAMATALGLAGFASSLQTRPTSTSKVICQEKEGRATLEFEIIWWPNLLRSSKHGKFQLHFFCPQDFVVMGQRHNILCTYK